MHNFSGESPKPDIELIDNKIRKIKITYILELLLVSLFLFFIIASILGLIISLIIISVGFIYLSVKIFKKNSSDIYHDGLKNSISNHRVIKNDLFDTLNDRRRNNEFANRTPYNDPSNPNYDFYNNHMFNK